MFIRELGIQIRRNNFLKAVPLVPRANSATSREEKTSRRISHRDLKAMTTLQLAIIAQLRASRGEIQRGALLYDTTRLFTRCIANL